MPIDLLKYKIPLEALRWECPLELLTENNEEELLDLPVIGQERAMKSLRLGLSIKKPGFNIFVSGFPGTGRHTTIAYLLKSHVSSKEVPGDWCYVYNFQNPVAPQWLSFQAGSGKFFQREMNDFILQFNRKVTTLLQGDFFLESQKRIFENFEKIKTNKLAEYEQQVTQFGLKLELIQTGAYTKFSLVTVTDGQVINLETPELTQSDKLEKLEHQLAPINQLAQVLQEIRNAEKAMRNRLAELLQKLVSPLLLQPINELKQKYPNPKIEAYLDGVYTALLADLENSAQTERIKISDKFILTMEELWKYQVNLVLDNSYRHETPIIFEEIPSLVNIFGTIERANGKLPPNFLNIRSGSLLQANGGYLVINISNSPNLNAFWRRLKQTLSNNQLVIEPNSNTNETPVITLRPEPIPLNLKIIVIGEDDHYYHLTYDDTEFLKLFKVRADFDTQVPRSNRVIQQYAAHLKKLSRQENWLPFQPSGLAALIEESVRLSGSQAKFSTQLQTLSDLAHEANYWAETDDTGQITRSHIETAIREQVERESLVEERIRERYLDGLTLINLTGSEIGQINSLVIREDGHYEFGKPNRITVRTSMGRSGIVNIDRDSDLSGRSHTKGISILKGFFRGTYAQDKEINLTASICFEQSYARIDGDSASAAELFALLSSIAQIPIRQDIAVTGSINQFGEIQPVGGVNEKIEGFFYICRDAGLTRTQGVIIPSRNTLDLQLRPEIVRAIQAGDFHIFCITSVNEGLEILSGIPAGKKDADGNFTEGTFHFLVDESLHELNRKDKENDD
jgi:predicted ATP-dependent protease